MKRPDFTFQSLQLCILLLLVSTVPFLWAQGWNSSDLVTPGSFYPQQREKGAFESNSTHHPEADI